MGGMFGGGGGGDDGGWAEIATALQQAIQQAPSYNPYQQFGGGGGAGAGAPSLLGGGTSGLISGTAAGGRGAEPTPTGGWQGSGNSQFIPGAANQLLRMGNSPQYNWY